MTQGIAIVGASVRAAAASAVRAGFQVAAADLRTIAMATKIDDYPNGLLHWLTNLRPQPAAGMYTGALENHPDLVDAMAAIVPLWGNRGSVLRKVRSPSRLAEALRQADLAFPETRDSSADLPRDGLWLVKTGRGASGSGVRALTDQIPKAAGVVYQRRVAGTPHSAVYVGTGGEAALLGVVQQLVGEAWLGAREFQYCGAIGPCHLPAATHAEIARIGVALAQEFGLVGLFGVDFVIDGNQVWTIEVNPRYTASVEIVERATGMPSIARHAVACVDNTPTAAAGENALTLRGKAILFARQSVAISAKFAEWALADAKQTQWPMLVDIPLPGTIVERGHPVLTVFAESASTEHVGNNLQDRVAEIERRLYTN